MSDETLSKFYNSIVESLKKSDSTTNAVTGVTVGLSVVATIYGINVVTSNPIGRTLDLFKTFVSQEKKRNIQVDSMINTYNQLHDDQHAGLEGRNSNYSTLVKNYYELATQFYEWGWGASFHFAYQLKGETFAQAIARHEYYLAGRLGVSKGEKLLDCGCGIGGPMRNIARFTRADIVGVTLSEHQVIRGNELNKAQGLLGQVISEQEDFMKLSRFKDNSFDGVYAIEATCHAPQREGVYGSIFRVLKPGRVFACYEWCLTPLFDKDSEYHQLIKKKIEEGDGLPDMATQEECVRALKAVGFELIEARDMALDERFGGDPWWLPLYPSYNPFSFRFQFNPFGKALLRHLLYFFEMIWLIPAGTYKVEEMLQQGGWGCAMGGQSGAFTPMWLMVARKPLK